ncbi:MAG: ABC transporter permease, partial [Acidobacteriota bacterium]
MFELLRGETKRIWIAYWRYPLDFISGLLVLFITFYVIIMGAEYVSGGQTSRFGGDRLSGLILGYWLWNLTR